MAHQMGSRPCRLQSRAPNYERSSQTRSLRAVSISPYSGAANSEPVCRHSFAAWQTKCFWIMRQLHFHCTKKAWLAERLQLMRKHAAAAAPVAS